MSKCMQRETHMQTYVNEVGHALKLSEYQSIYVKVLLGSCIQEVSPSAPGETATWTGEGF